MRPVAVGLGGGEPRIRVSPTQGDYGNSSPFLRGHAVRRSRRGRLKSRLKLALAMFSLVVVPAVTIAWLMTSPRFAVQELSVVTGQWVPELWVREELAPLLGENLPRLPLTQAEEILLSHPWVWGADLRKDLPARLTVRVTERQAVALLRASDGFHYLDPQGIRIAPFSPTSSQSVDLPLISISDRLLSRTRSTASSAGPDGAPTESSLDRRAAASSTPADPAPGAYSAVQLLTEIQEAAPAWIAGLSEIEVLGEEDFCIYTSSLPFPVLVTTGTLHQRVRRLEELMPQIVARSDAGAAVDLRFARRIIVKPSADLGAGHSWPVSTAEHREATEDHAQRG